MTLTQRFALLALLVLPLTVTGCAKKGSASGSAGAGVGIVIFWPSGRDMGLAWSSPAGISSARIGYRRD